MTSGSAFSPDSRAPGEPVIQELGEYHPYDEARSIFRRTWLIVAAYFVLSSLIRGMLEGWPIGKILVSGGISAFVGGGFAAVIMAAFGGRRTGGTDARRELAAQGYRYGLACGWMTGPHRVVAGVLYLGPQGFRFVPHPRVRKSLRRQLVMEPLRDVELQLLELPVTLRHQFTGETRVQRIELRWAGGTARFTAPRVEAAFGRMRAAVAQLSAEPAAVGY